MKIAFKQNVFQNLRQKKFMPIFVLTFLLFLFWLVNRDGDKKPGLDLESGLSAMSLDASKNIFFLESSNVRNEDRLLKLNNRQACSIESAALMNPNANVFVIFASNSNLEMTEYMHTLLSYKNIFLRRLDFYKFAEGTPIKDWIQTDALSTSKFMTEHVSDILRLLILWKYGGIYFDLDVVSQSSIDSIGESNYACAQFDDPANAGFICNAIISIQDKVGREVTELFLKDLVTTFNGTAYAYNGPQLLTRVVKKLCETEKKTFGDDAKCSNFKVLPQDKCYKITWPEWEYFFKDEYTAKALEMLKESYFMHVWNNLSKNFTLKTNSNAAYIQIAKKFCPQTFKLAGEIF